MAAYYPIPSTRTSGLMFAQRMLAQLQSAQLDLLRAQNQVSTGKRLEATSDDPGVAVRAMALRRTIERKAQIKTNLQAAESYLNASDSALSTASGLLADIRAAALSAVGTTSSDTQRRAVAEEVSASISQFLNIANSKFRDRYLFAGSGATSEPFTQNGGYIRYNGNEVSLNTFSDLDQLLATNSHGVDVFGAVWPQQRGTVDLQPILTESTQLSELHGGAGVRLGTIVVSDGVNSSAVDLSHAATISDVIQAIQRNPPAGREIVARVDNNRLTITLVNAGTDALTIRDAVGSTTAADLGILETVQAPGGIVQGSDLNPQLTPTTRLADLLGTRASAVVAGAGDNNDLFFEAKHNGWGWSGLNVQFVDDAALQSAPGLAAGSERVEYHSTPVAARAGLRLVGTANDLVLTANVAGVDANNVTIRFDSSGDIGDAATANYDSNTRTLTLSIDNTGETTLDTLVNTINGQGLFTAAADPSAGESYDGLSSVSAANSVIVSGTTGNSGAEANTIQVFVNRLHTNANQVIAAIQGDAVANSLVSVRLDGRDTTSAASAGLGQIDLAASGTTAGGSGEDLDLSSGLRIVNNGQTYNINFAQAQTVEDLLNLLNGSPAGVTASINEAGTGIDIRSRLSGADFQIGENGGRTATQLGLRSFDRGTNISDLNYGAGVEQADGADLIIQRSDGTQLSIDLAGVFTVGDLIDRINNDPNNQNPFSRVAAQFVSTGNGIELVDNSFGTEPLTLIRPTASHAAWDLGLIPRGSDQAVSTSSGPPWSIAGGDVNPLESKGVFNSLLRVQNALLANDETEIARATALLDGDIDRLSFARSEIGARGQAIDLMQLRWEDENVELVANLSYEIDADPVEAITSLTQKQFAYQAALQASAQLFQMSLLDYL